MSYKLEPLCKYDKEEMCHFQIKLNLTFEIVASSNESTFQKK